MNAIPTKRETTLRLREKGLLPTDRFNQRVRIAYHEAGHLIVGAALEGAPCMATIVPGKKLLGSVKFRRAGVSARSIQTDLAGFASENIVEETYRDNLLYDLVQIARLGKLEECDFSLHDHDHYRAVESALRLGAPESVNSLIGRCYASARDSLLAAWPSVERAAEALLNKGTIDEDEIGELLLVADDYELIRRVQIDHGFAYCPEVFSDGPGVVS